MKCVAIKALVLTGFLFVLPSYSVADIAMIVNKQNSLTTVELKEVKLLYLGKRKKIGGVKVTPVALQDEHETTKVFVNGVLSKTLQQHRGYWARIVFTGKGAPPQQLKSSAEVKKWIIENPASIGFIDSADVDDTVKVTAMFK